MAEKRSTEEILSTDPFDKEEPTEYEIYLHEALKLAFANIRGMTHALSVLDKRMEEHDRAHATASMAAMNVPDIKKEDRLN